MNKLFRLLLLSFIFASTIWCCSGNKGKNIPDVSNIKVSANIERIEQELFALDPTNVKEGLDKIMEAHPEFMHIYLNVILRDLTAPDKTPDEIVAQFISNDQIRSLYDTCLIVHKDIPGLEKDFETAFKYYKHYFPDRQIPKLVSYISEFGLGTFAYGDSLIAIGWDFYLGADYPYDLNYFPRYIQKGMTRDHIVAKAIEALMNNEVGDPKGSRLIDHMIHNGKIHYLVDQLLPYTPDSIKLVYAQQQVEWCEKNELQMWSHLLGENLLYSSKMRDFQKMISPSPSSAPQMPPESPGRAANWIGWQIVKKYMERNPEETLEDLIAETDAQYILDKSKYKPR